ncbi:uncharacterized protein LOC109707940 [Ananas comosus]|uniref:Uncharacterized protein LOC109707940 n=2 Tax=Ananas comosus TaxID=4615 RepID=A0A6P5ENM7_ANACO|nr:uncharacterized protein LOC109707940 [Ananas comosus]CAD1844733.1 unnamed protein product [Ananas comosus var. bracteatus]
MEITQSKRDHHFSAKRFFLKSQGKPQTAAEAIEKLHGGRVVSREEENGVVRVKIVVSKKELKQMLAGISGIENTARGHQTGGGASAPQSLEQLRHVLRRRRAKKLEEGAKGLRGEWQPQLQSIPEEI